MADSTALVSREALVKTIQYFTGRSDVTLLDGYSVDRATSGVEGFTSMVLRVKLSYRLPEEDELKSIAIIVKRTSLIEAQRELISTTQLFPKECFFYRNVFPAIAKVSNERVRIPFPICYHSTGASDDAAFYMEDLISSGFRAAKRSYLSNGIDYPHCRIVMKGLGRLHALSMAAEKTLEPRKGGWVESFPELDRECFYYVSDSEKPPSIVQNMADGLTQNITELCREIEGLPKEAEAAGVLQKALDRAWPTFCRFKVTPERNRRVVTHGDCWINNVMFRYEKGEEDEEVPVDVKFFDFQVSKVSHPCIDILHFMHTGTRRPFREKYLSTLADEYYASLTENMKLLDNSSPPFSLDEFRRELLVDYKPYGIIMATLFTPLQLLGDDFLLPNADDMTEEKYQEMCGTGSVPQIKFRFHNDRNYRSQVESILREFVDMAFPNGLESLNSSPLFHGGS